MTAASVIIPNWNGAHLLPTCLDALRQQSRRDFEVVVVDNASTDSSVALLAERYPEARVLPQPRNLGFTGAVNAGIRATAAPYIVLLNSDTEAAPGWLEALLSAFEAAPEVGMVASRMMLYDRRDVFNSAGDLFGRDGIPRNRGVWEQDSGQYEARAYVFGPCGGGAAYSRALLDDCGPFWERLFMYLEDVDMAWRAQLRGYRCVFEPQATLYHRLSATGGGALASYYTGRNTLAVLARDVPGPLLRRHWARVVAAQLRIAADAVRAWRGAAARARLRGQLAGLALAPSLLGERRAIQRSRRVSIDYLESILA